MEVTSLCNVSVYVFALIWCGGSGTEILANMPQHHLPGLL